MTSHEIIRDLLVESAVQRLLARYCDALWRQDVEVFARCFSKEALWTVAGVETRGRDAIADRFATFMAATEKAAMFVNPPLLHLEPEVGGVVQITEYVRRRDGSTLRTLGLYHDRYVQEDGQWRFAERRLELVYRGPADFSGPFEA